MSLALAFSAPFVLPSDNHRPIPVSHPYIHRVDCAGGRGTAVQFNQRRAISVDHVTSMADCRINGVPIKVIESDPRADFSIIEYEFPRRGGIRLSCAGFGHGRHYTAMGHAGGLPVQHATSGRFIFGLPRARPEWVTLWTPTRFIRGMSGGAVFDTRTGSMVGTVNALSLGAPLSFSRSLSETSLCSRSA